MKILLQRVKNASVAVNGQKIAEIGKGLLLFVGLKESDEASGIRSVVGKIAGLRVFEDSEGKFNLSVTETGGEILLVPQFTLYGECSKGRRPDFTAAAPVEKAKMMYDNVVKEFGKTGLRVKSGVFRAHMEVSLINDGPVTLMIEK